MFRSIYTLCYCLSLHVHACIYALVQKPALRSEMIENAKLGAYTLYVAQIIDVNFIQLFTSIIHYTCIDLETECLGYCGFC